MRNLRCAAVCAWVVIALAMVAVPRILRAGEQRPDSILVASYEFDRGNVAVYETGWADAEPCILNGGPQPNTTEYDLDLPVGATYVFHAKYAAADSRPVDITLDDAVVHRGFRSTTGSWQSSTARWEQQCEIPITKGKHTIKLICPGPCMPHIVAFRLDSPVPFPAGFKRKRRPMPASRIGWSGQPAPGRTGYQAYVRDDGFVDAPSDYDPNVPFERIPLPAPNAERILEFLLMDPARCTVDARIEPSDEDAHEWVAHLSVKVSDTRTDTAVLPLQGERVRKMLGHAIFLIGRFCGKEPRSPRARLWAELRAQAGHLGRELDATLALPDGKGKWSRVYELYVDAYRLKSRVALSNPLLDFRKLLFAKRLTYDTSHIYTTYFDGSHRYGGNLHTLSPVRPDGRAETLVKGLKEPAIYRDPDLSWDARRVLFSHKPDAETPCRLYEVGIDGSGLRQLTNTDYDDIDPCYLPDGRVMFVSTRCRRVVLCHNAFTVSVLYTMNADGSGVRCVSPNTVNEFTPSVTASGQVVYTRWEYVDKNLGNNQSLWGINPDGSRAFHLAGAHWGPITFWEPRQIPGSHKLVCTLAPHMPLAVGPIALVDPLDTCASPAAYENITRELPPPRHFGWQRTDAGYYSSPYPLSEEFFIVSYCYGPDDRAPAGYGLYLLDRWNHRDLIYRDPEISCFEALPVKARPRPPVLPRLILAASPAGSRERERRVAAPPAEAEAATSAVGTLCLLDVYRGLPGIARGTVKHLRVIEEIAKPVSANVRGDLGLQYPQISNVGNLALKRILGTVPVHPDGSAYFTIPADRAVYFSALDADGMEIQRMRSFTHVAAGERVTCIGCHEHRQTSPPNHRTLALRRPPVAITPPVGGPHAPDFAYDVQPVLNRHCVSCHGGAAPAGGLDLSPDHTNLFNVAYESLTGHGYVSFINTTQSSNLPLRPAKYYGSHASKLMKVLRGSHRDRVKVPREGFARLAEWIDCNAPYYGTYRFSRPGTVGGRELISPAVRGSLDGLFARRCASCHGGETARVTRIRYPGVDKSPALLAPLARDAGGTGACGKPVFAGRGDPDCQALLGILKQVAEETRRNPREDMLASRPPLLDETCAYRYR